jgi:hypothetical protein
VSAQPARHLRVVGESVIDEGGFVLSPAEMLEEITKLKTDLKMAQRDVRTKNRKIAELERDKVQERLDYERRGEVERVARYWWRRCRAGDRKVHYMSPDRFDAVRELMDMERLVVVDGKKRKEPVYSMEDFKRAIDGAWFDCFESKRRNGSTVRYDDLTLICRSAAKFEEFIQKAPM